MAKPQWPLLCDREAREGPCWLNLPPLFDKPVTGDAAARCPGEKLFCDVVLRTFWFFTAFPPLNSNSTFFVLFWHHLTWERARGQELEFLVSRQVSAPLPMDVLRKVICTIFSALLINGMIRSLLSHSIFLRTKQHNKGGNTCQITRQLANISLWSISFYTLF